MLRLYQSRLFRLALFRRQLLPWTDGENNHLGFSNSNLISALTTPLLGEKGKFYPATYQMADTADPFTPTPDPLRCLNAKKHAAHCCISR